MTQPITYYAQNDAIDSLAEKYGSSFQTMTRAQKLLVLALIVNYLSGGSIEIQLIYPYSVTSEFVQEWERFIEESSERDLTGLMLAITAQLHDKVYAEGSH